MSKLKLKAAMESLQVNKPLKLQNRQPQFKVPPTISADTLVAGETQVAATTKVHTQTPVTTETMVPEPTQVSTQTMVSRETQVDADTTVPAQTKVAVQTKVGIVRNSTRNPSDQDSSVTLEAQTAPKLHQGYTRLPNNILMRMASGDLVRSEMQILLLIARFTISFQKRHAPLSKAVLERQTGLRGPAVLQAISDLVAKGLIEKIAGDQHRPNQLGLVLDNEWDFFPKSKSTTAATTLVPPQTQVAVQTMVVLETPVPMATFAQVPVPTPAGVAGATYFKDIETIENKISLSSQCSSALLQKYFSKLKTARKRESEEKAFEDLRRDFTEREIESAFEYLSKHETSVGKKTYHSPMAYLAMAMGEVSQILKNQRKREVGVKRAQEVLKSEAANQARQKAQEEEEAKQREQAFLQRFPAVAEQQTVIAKFATRFPMLDSKGSIVRNLAISAWWEEMSRK